MSRMRTLQCKGGGFVLVYEKFGPTDPEVRSGRCRVAVPAGNRVEFHQCHMEESTRIAGVPVCIEHEKKVKGL